MINSFKCLEPYSRRPDQRFYMAGVGLYEAMEPEIINRPHGTWDWLFMFFHSPVILKVNGRETMYPGNTLMIWDDSQGHYYGNQSQQWAHSWIHCQGSVVREYVNEAGLKPGVFPALDCVDVLESYLPRIYEERIRPDMSAPILEGLFRCLLHAIRRIQAPTIADVPARILAIKHYIDSHYATPLRLGDLCDRAAMSKPHLIAEFKKYIGAPPIDYLIRVRLDHARSLLLNRNLTISDVAAQVGYSDIYHFSKLFKKHIGQSPSAFRV